MVSSTPLLAFGAALLSALPRAHGARQPYDVRKIISAFRRPHADLKILCAHRGLRWNGTADNSFNGYFRAAEAGIECIETDLQISKDGVVTMIYDAGLGRETDIGEFMGKPAYNPYTGKGYNPLVKDMNWAGTLEHLHLRDEVGRVQGEKLPTLRHMVEYGTYCNSLFDPKTSMSRRH